MFENYKRCYFKLIKSNKSAFKRFQKLDKILLRAYLKTLQFREERHIYRLKFSKNSSSSVGTAYFYAVALQLKPFILTNSINITLLRSYVRIFKQLLKVVFSRCPPGSLRFGSFTVKAQVRPVYNYGAAKVFARLPSRV